MSIPLDKLYHYIESIAREIRGDDVIIYRFYPHGSKKLEDLTQLYLIDDSYRIGLPPLYCYDQEPLNYNLYCNLKQADSEIGKLFKKYNVQTLDNNLMRYTTIYDRALLLHSEKRSFNKELYEKNNFITVYYWSHAIISLDWFRFAKHEHQLKDIKKTFLIYNRAWSGTREYRLKFIDLLIKYNLIEKCQVTFNPIEPGLDIHYTQHHYKNNSWVPDHHLEYYIPNKTFATSNASAGYVIEDYNATEFEVVLETLFDDDRIHLTEKALRPIAVGQPFILAATQGSLEYLRSYGFRTFGTIVDESYDLIEDPQERLDAVVSAMKKIANWTNAERTEKMAIANQIASYNRKHFFSNKFFNQVTDELRSNLKLGLEELENTNTSSKFFDRVKKLSTHQEIVDYYLNIASKKDIVKLLAKAKRYTKH